ncbi:MAG: cell envelope biogenesis protein OmpA [Sulfurovum sp.]|nr:MAG: cell envelope biogenesis protein OmpA [Sulfurovum sp.]
MIKRTKLTMTVLAVSSASLILLSGCANKTQSGAAIGAGTGALIGSMVGNSGTALAGAAIGGLAGGAIGHNEDNKDRARSGY